MSESPKVIHVPTDYYRRQLAAERQLRREALLQIALAVIGLCIGAVALLMVRS